MTPFSWICVLVCCLLCACHRAEAVYRGPAVTHRFKHWFQEHGGEGLENVRIIPASTPDGGVTVRARKTIRKHKQIVGLPSRLLIRPDVVDEHPVLGQVPLPRDHLTLELYNNLKLAMYLAYYKVSNTTSFWDPYFAILPDKYETCGYFTESDWAGLEGFHAGYEALAMNKRRRSVYDRSGWGQWCDGTNNALPEEFCRFESFRWAYTTVMSRSMHLNKEADGSDVAMVPMLDLLNHNPVSLANAVPRIASSGMQFFSSRRINPGEEITWRYSELSPVQLLTSYGFNLLQDPVYTTRIHFGWNPDITANYRMLFVEDLAATLKYDGDFPVQFVTGLAIWNMPLGSLPAAQENGGNITHILVGCQEAEKLLRSIQQSHERYHGPIEQDEAILNWSPHVRERQLALVRFVERKVVEANLARIVGGYEVILKQYCDSQPDPATGRPGKPMDSWGTPERPDIWLC